MAAPRKTCTTIEQRGVVRFLWEKIWQQRICCPCMMNIACHVKQSSKTASFGGTLSWRWRGWKSSARMVPTATTRILRRRFPGTCEMVGQVFKFVWRLHWKINAVCMSLFPFDSFQSRFVTYLLTYSRILAAWSTIYSSRKRGFQLIIITRNFSEIISQVVMRCSIWHSFFFSAFTGPCIVIYSYNKSQQDAIFLNFILVNDSTCFGETYCPSSGVLILYSGICHTEMFKMGEFTSVCIFTLSLNWKTFCM